MVMAFAMTQAHPRIASAASANPGNLTLATVSNTVAGCPLGSTYTFCDQVTGTAGTPETFLINSSAAVSGVSVAIAAIPGLSANFAAGDFTITANTCSGSLGANQQCDISVAFSPTAAGLRQAAITVTDSSGDSLAINIEGTGKNLTLAPAASSPNLPNNAFTYSGQPVGSASAPQTFTVTAGKAVSGITVTLTAIPGLESEFSTGATGDFTVTGNGCGALAPGTSCAITIEFTPTAVGLRAALLTATDSGGDSTTLYLAGYGNNGRGGATQAGGLFFAFSVPGSSTAACDRVNYFGFCSVPSGGISTDTSTFTLQNVSGSTITGLAVPKGSVVPASNNPNGPTTPPDFTVKSSTCPQTLDASASCTITISFTPTNTGLRQGAIVVTDTQGDVATVNLAGVGSDYSIAPQLPVEVSVEPGGTAKFSAQLMPDSVFGQNGEQVTFVCPTNLPTNTSCVITPCPATVMPATSSSVQISIVTSSASVVAPIPTSGCSSYGPSQTATFVVPTGDLRASPIGNAPATPARPGRFPVSWAFGILAALGLLLGWLAMLGRPGRARRRVPLIFAFAGLAAAALMGCHKKGVVATTATPNATTTLTLMGNALDVNGNSLNASRTFQVTLVVEQP